MHNLTLTVMRIHHILDHSEICDTNEIGCVVEWDECIILLVGVNDVLRCHE